MVSNMFDGCERAQAPYPYTYQATEPAIFEQIPETGDIRVCFNVGSQIMNFYISRSIYAKYFVAKDLKEVMTQLLKYVVVGVCPEGIWHNTESRFMEPAPIFPEPVKIEKEELPLCHCLRTLWKRK